MCSLILTDLLSFLVNLSLYVYIITFIYMYNNYSKLCE